jgi:hypothetical protein
MADDMDVGDQGESKEDTENIGERVKRLGGKPQRESIVKRYHTLTSLMKNQDACCRKLKQVLGKMVKMREMRLHQGDYKLEAKELSSFTFTDLSPCGVLFVLIL